MKTQRWLTAFLATTCAIGFSGCHSVQEANPLTKTTTPLKERQHYELTPEQRDQQYQRQVNQNSVEGYRTK